MTKAANVIYNNHENGVSVQGSYQTKIYGNYIGLKSDGTTVEGNFLSGVKIEESSTGTEVGKAGGFGNVISGNLKMGVYVFDSETMGNKIVANKIGTDAAGTARKANGEDGIRIENARDTQIGGVVVADRNLISGNKLNGVRIIGADASFNRIIGNYIGTDVTGNAALKNDGSGVLIQSPQNYVGGGNPGEGNLISGNGGHGVNLLEFVDEGLLVSSADLNLIAGNLIGTNQPGTAAIKNHGSGVSISGDNNDVGMAGPPGRNVISGNGHDGVHISRGNANKIVNNYIGTTKNGLNALGNGDNGVFLSGGSNTTNTTIGGSGGANTRNVISANGTSGFGHGIDIAQHVSGTTILGNFIGTDANGAVALGNEKEGVHVTSGSTNTTIGGVGENEGNVISGNKRFGLSVNSASSTITNNRVGYKSSNPLASLPNNNQQQQVDPTGQLGTWTPDNLIWSPP